jgi:hypothetical protein
LLRGYGRVLVGGWVVSSDSWPCCASLLVNGCFGFLHGLVEIEALA